MTILFDASYVVLGEFTFHQGTLASFLLTADGERRIGKEVQQWFVEGMEGLNLDEQVAEEGGHMIRVRLWRILPRTPEAIRAFSRWANQRNFLVVELPERLESHWHRLTQLSLEPEERYTSLMAMRNAPHRLLNAWSQALNEF